MEIKRTREEHSLPGGHRGNKSGHGKVSNQMRSIHQLESTEEGKVMTRKETEQARDTHVLKTAEEGTNQDTQINRASEGHSQTGCRRRRDLSGHGNKATVSGALTDWRPYSDKSGHRQESDRVRDTHRLETTEGWTRQDTYKKGSEGHSQTGDHRRRDKLKHGKKATDKGHSLTGDNRA